MSVPLPPPGPMPPPGMPPGPPPGMPPGMGMPPPPPMPGIPPGPPPMQAGQGADVPPPTAQDIILEQIRRLREDQGDDFAREQVAGLDPEVLSQMREWQLDDPYASSILDDVMPVDESGPVYPSWFELVRPARPSTSEVNLIAMNDWERWARVREAIRENLEYYHQEVGAAYQDFDTDKDELFHDDTMVSDINAIIAKIAAKTVTWQFEVLDAAHAEDAQKAEDAVAYWFDGADRRHRRAGNRSIKRDVTSSFLLSGWACARVALNLVDDEQPVTLVLVDPATAVPFFDEFGLSRVTRRYQDTIAGVLSAFGDPTGKIKRQLLAKLNEEGEARRLSDYIEVITYDDRWWRCVIADGITVIPPTAHEYGFCPWEIQGLELGEPVFLTGALADNFPVSGLPMNQDRLHLKHVSPIHFWKHQHAQKEAIMSKMFTMWKHADKPAWLWYYDEFAKKDGIPETPGQGKVTPLKINHEDMKPMIEKVDPNIFGTLIQAHVAGEQRSHVPLASLGGTDDANTSGHAIGVMSEQGAHIFSPVEESVAGFLAGVGEKWLTLWRDWGHLHRGNTGEYGVTRIPYMSRRAWRGGDPAFRLVPEVVERCGTRINVELTELNLSTLTPLANALGQLKSLGWMPNSKAITMLGFPDPEDVVEEVEYDEIRADPAIKMLRRYESLKARNARLAEDYREMVIKQSQPPPAPMGMGMGMGPGMGPGMGMGPGPGTQIGPFSGPGIGGPGFEGGLNPTSSAMNLAALGMGAQGPTGRPMGAAGPPPAPFPGGPPTRPF